MYKLCNFDIDRSKKIYQELKEFVSLLKKKFSITEIYLYGSFAREESHEGSDIDLVIVGNFKGRIFERIGKILEITDLPIEPLVYTPGEFEQMRKNGNPFIRKVIGTGKKL